MVKKNAWKRMLAAALALVTVLSNVVSPMTAYAADSGGESYPKLSEVQEQLSTDEVVTAKDIEVDYGSDFKVSSDFTGISYDAGAVTITLHEAKNSSGASYSSTSPGDYQAVYYVKPTSGDPSYRVSRTITVKKAQKETEATVSAASEENTGDSDGSGEADDDGDSDDSADADHAENSNDPADADAAEDSGDPAGADAAEDSDDSADANAAEDSGDPAETAETGSDALSTEGGTELTTEEFEAEIEQSEEQETVDEETGMTLATALEEAEEAGIDLAALEVGETVTVSASSLTSSKEEVKITRGSWYYYADYGLGSYMTAPYYISYGSITATAYCVQPSRDAPDDGTYTITKLKDSKTLAKVCYYGTKASGDEGFFAENYPSFSTGKRFIITHLAAAYANGSGDAFSGANSTGKALAMELYNYCLSQPEIPDVDMAFSNDTVTAYLSGSEQRTEEVTFEADELQTVTFDLPDGVKLHNTTTGKTSAAGASVTISGGTTFYLSAPLTQAADVNASWSTTMKGSITKEYSAYKITTGSSTQDLAFVFGEGVDSEKYVSFKVTWLKLAYIRVVKSDADSGNALSGAVFGVYSDAACTQLIDTMTATGSDGVSELQIVMTQSTVYLKELTTPTGYLLNTTVYPVELEVGSTTTVSVPDERVTAHISLTKTDSETGGTAQGDATLEGAVYGLYAREDIVHPDGTTGVLYQAGDQVATLTTDANGEAEIGGLYLGAYYVKELTPSEGYNLDETEYDLTCDYEGDLVATVERSCTSQEDVIKQPFQVIKAANNGKTDADLLSGVGFTVYLVSSLGVNADGSYDFASAEPVVVTADGGTKMFTDETGYACSIALPYGTYLVRETTTPHNYEPVDDFIVTITEHKPNEPQVWRILLDKEFEAKLKIIKKDDETKQTVLQANTEFKVYDLENNCYVEQVTTYPTTTVHTSYFTDEQGYLILPNALTPGTYRIEEVTAPYGYTRNTGYVEVCVDTNTAYLTDFVSGDVIIEVVCENHPVKGELTIVKSGETLADYNGDFLYGETALEGATFEVYAAEDIYTSDFQTDANGNRNLVYAKGALVATVTTDADGKAVVSDLPLGTYEVQEVNAPYGYTLNTVSQEVEFAYAGQDTAVVSETLTFSNERQKVSLAVEKQDAQTGNVVSGAVFGIYSAENITANGEVIVPADTLLQEMTSDENGLAVCTLDLPLGQYYVKEISAPAGFVSSDEVLTFDASYRGQDVEVVKLTSVKKNEPTTVEFTKSDLTTGVELSGASLYVMDSNGTVVDSWVSVAGEAHVIQYLVVGETYTLHEEIAPYGYLKATEITFTVEDTAEVQPVEMQDDVPTASLIINKKGEFLDSVILVNVVKGIVEHIFNYVTGNLTDVTFEVYAAEDIKAADGVSEDYYKADELVATLTTDEYGIAKLEGLPLGQYYVKEIGTVYGYVLDNEIRYVDLRYQDQDTPVVVYDEAWQNERQKVSVHVVKTEKDTGRTLQGAIFGLYAAEDIVSASGTVLIEADEIIELKVTDENGAIDFTADLPLDGSYYVKELYAPNGFVTTGEVQSFTVTWQGENVAEQTVELAFENEPTTVEITKTDLTTGEELPGAHLKVVDETGAVVDEWVSTTEAHIIKELVVGKTYTLIETKPADGYVTAESIDFTIENTAEIQHVVMEDDVTTVEITKTDLTTGEELPGAHLKVVDETGAVVDEWISTSEAHTIQNLVVGKTYTLIETKPADGYVTAESIQFTIEDTAEIQHVVMEDDVTKVKISKQDIAGNELPGAKLTIYDADGNVVESWTSTSKPHYIEMLPIGTYTLREETAPDGYLVAEDVTFEVLDTGEVQCVTMVDEAASAASVTSVPKTGDNSNVALWLTLLLASLAGLGCWAVLSIRRRNREQD